MKIFIYGDSNTWGCVPNLEGYSKNAKIKQFNKEDIWWHPLIQNNEVIVNGLCGRAINNENPWLEGRNATKTINDDIKNIKADLTIIMLGTNDCKSMYNLTAEDITNQLKELSETIESKLNAKIMIISPVKIKEGNKITDKYYKGAEEKSIKLANLYNKLAQEKNYLFVSALDLNLGEDGEHLTLQGHKTLANLVLNKIKEI